MGGMVSAVKAAIARKGRPAVKAVAPVATGRLGKQALALLCSSVPIPLSYLLPRFSLLILRPRRPVGDASWALFRAAHVGAGGHRHQPPSGPTSRAFGNMANGDADEDMD